MSIPSLNIKWMSGRALSDRDPYSDSERRNSHPASKVVKPFELYQQQRTPRLQFPESEQGSANPRQNPDLHLKSVMETLEQSRSRQLVQKINGAEIIFDTCFG